MKVREGKPMATEDDKTKETGKEAEKTATDQPVGRRATWAIGLILIPCAILFLLLLFLLWPPPKPRQDLTLTFHPQRQEVAPGNPVTYTISVHAPSGVSESVTLQAIVTPDDLTYGFAPHEKDEPKKGLLVPSPIGSSATLTLQIPPGLQIPPDPTDSKKEAKKNYSISIVATGHGQTKTRHGDLVVKKNVQEPLKQDTSEEGAAREGASELRIFSWKLGYISDEVRLFLIVAVVGCLGGLLHSIRSFIEYAGSGRLTRNWIPFYASTPIVGMTMAILFYLVFRAGFVSPATPAAETNAYGFAAIAGLVGLFSFRAARMLEHVADILFTKLEGDFQLTASGSPQTVAPGAKATYAITVTATEDFSASVTLTPAVDPVRDKGPTVTLNPTGLTPTRTGTAATLAADTAADTPPGEYKITVTATGGGKTHTVEVILTVANGTVSPGDFQLTAAGSPQTVAPGSAATYSITATATQGFSASVTLTPTVDPRRDRGPTVTLSPTGLTPTTTGTPVILTASTAADTPPGAYKITITATGGGETHTVEVTLTVAN